MSFADSFNFGNSTFLNLEKLENNNLKENNSNNIPNYENKPLKQSCGRLIQNQKDSVQHKLSLCTEENSFKNIETISKEEEQRYLSKWNLPNTILQEYKKKGIEKMFKWQLECLSIPKVLFENANLIYSAPTSAGKTLVSELLLVKTLVERNKKAIIILPFISVVREKLNYFQEILSSSGYKIEGYYGGYNSSISFEKSDLAICTIEKANSIINKLLEQNKLDDLGILVVDEIHLISDKSRGYILEILLSKILYVSREEELNIQIIAMSATLANASLLQDWLHAELYQTEYRPVELKEMLKICDNIYDNKLNFIKTIKNVNEIPNDQDHIAQLCIETILEGCSILIFCPSKEWCESLCLLIAKSIHYCLNNINSTEVSEKIKNYVIGENLNKMIDKFCKLSTGFDDALKKSLLFACAFHHAGLTFEERELIEVFFKSGDIKVIVATSTLSSGVNLPARRVIIRSPLFGGKLLNPLTYKQMIGRAGRTGQDTIGESILICNYTNSKMGKSLFNSELEPITSSLHYDNFTHFKRAFLEAISSNIVTNQDELIKFSKCTLFYTENIDKTNLKVMDLICENVNFLKEQEFIRISKDANDVDCYLPSKLGNACLNSSIPPKEALVLLSELQKARRCFVLDSDLHAIYLVTPYNVCYQLADLDWLFYLELWEKLPISLKRVGELIGIKESFLVRAMRGNSKLDHRLLQIHKRFYTALALQDLINEVPISTVASKFKCTRGLIQSLQQMSSTFAGIVTQFCSSLKWGVLALIISELKDRLQFGVQRDLIDLTRLSELNCQKARALYNAGIENLNDLARSNVITVEKVLLSCIAFESEKYDNEGSEYDQIKGKKIRNSYIKEYPNITITETAKLLILNARHILKKELGVEDMKWKEHEINISKSDNLPEAKCNIPEIEVLNLSKTIDTSSTNKNIENLSNHNFSSNQGNGSSIIELVEIEDNSVIENENYERAENKENSSSINLLNISEDDLNVNIKMSDMEQSFQNISIEAQSETELKKYFNNSRCNDLEFLWNDSTLNLDSKIVQQLDNIKEVKINTINNNILKSKSSSSKSSFEISNLSQLSLMKYPNLLNNSQSLKNETQNDLINSIDIIDICGNEDLFQKSVQEILGNDLLNLSFSLESLKTSKLRKMIGKNLLINKSNIEDKKLFEHRNEFYVDGISIAFGKNFVLYLNLQSTPKVPQNLKIDFLNKIFKSEKYSLNILDAKEQLKIVYSILSTAIIINAKIQDPKIASWLVNPNDKFNLKSVTKKHAPQCYSLFNYLKEQVGWSCIGLNYKSPYPGYIRSAIEAFVTSHIFNDQIKNLFTIENRQITKFFNDLEMPMQIILSQMEYIGFPINENFLKDLINIINETIKLLQQRIFDLHGKQFNIESVAEVAKVLGIHKNKNQKYSTSRQILEKIDSPISDLLINFRKLKFILNNNIYPFLKAINNKRIHGNSNTFTSTGRISMHEPNLQNIARTFEVDIDTNTKITISCRNVMCAADNYCLISADFSQLEIRVLTHLSQDPILMSVVRTNADLFTSIASIWNKIPESEINSKLREATKQVCYGIIYGMGTTALCEVLKCSEAEAKYISRQFHEAYPGIREYIQKITKFAKQNGYVETITGRRRYLPLINSDIKELRAKAERQAINTTIQGSAADIVKSSILRMDKNILKYHNKVFNDNAKPRFILHVHDELIYEIPKDKIQKFARIFKLTLESTVKLSIPLKVKLKVGKSWGELQDYVL